MKTLPHALSPICIDTCISVGLTGGPLAREYCGFCPKYGVHGMLSLCYFNTGKFYYLLSSNTVYTMYATQCHRHSPLCCVAGGQKEGGWHNLTKVAQFRHASRHASRQTVERSVERSWEGVGQRGVSPAYLRKGWEGPAIVR